MLTLLLISLSEFVLYMINVFSIWLYEYNLFRDVDTIQTILK